MSRDEHERLRDIKDAIGAIREHLQSVDKTALKMDDQMAGLRDLIAHEYFRIDIHRVLEIVERDLPPLEHAVDRLLASS